MTDGTIVLFWERAIERLLIVLFGGVSLILGWHLFKTGILKQQQASSVAHVDGKAP